MKKLTLLLMSLFISLLSFAGEITEEQALQKAQQFMQGKQFKQNITRRAASTANKAYYVFNVENKGGFVIVAGDDRMPEILGYGEKGNLDVNNAPCGLKWLLGAYEHMAKDMADDKVQSSRSARAAKATIAPFITTAWGQGAPYNAMCPEHNGARCLTGCVATAMAQVVNYCRWPIGQTNCVYGYSASIGNVEYLDPTQFDWNDMTNDDIARLMRYCGQSVMTDYGPSSGAQSTVVPDALINVFGYSQATHYVKHAYYDEEEWEDLLYNELTNQRPVIYDGYFGSIGHAFVVHGYKEGRFYINWGWNGDEDGYFLLTGLTTSAGTFSSNQGATIGICSPTNNDRPKVVVKSISSQNNKFTPRDDEGNIYSIQVNCVLTSDVNEQKTLQIGLALYSGDSFQKILCSESHDFQVGETYNYFTFFDLENIANGTYRVVAVWRDSENDSWHADANSSENYLEITLDDERMRMRTFPMSMEDRQTEEVVATVDGLTYCFKTVNSLKLATVMNEKKHKPSGNLYIPDDVTYNGVKYHVYDAESGAFDNSPELTSLSTAMTRFPYVQNCDNLTSLELREGVTYMEGFGNCFKIESIELPKSVIYVSQVSADYSIKTIRFKNPNTFDYQMSFGYPEEWITSLTDIYFASPYAPKLNLSAIETFPVNTHVTIHVPEGAMANYEAGGWTGWNIVEDQPLPTEQSIECGYCTGTETAMYDWGHDCGNNNGEYAIRILPEMLKPFIGKTIDRIRFNPGFKPDYVFITSAGTDYIVKQPAMGENGSWQDAILSEPYTITGETLYIGWGAHNEVSANSAINEDPTSEGCWYRVMGTDTNNDMQPGIWENCAEKEFYRPLPIKFYVSFSDEDLLNDLAANKVSVVSKGGDQYTFKAKITNCSPKTIGNYTVAWDIDGKVKGEKTFQTSLVNNQFETIDFDVSATLSGKDHRFNYEITSIDGQPDDYAANSSGTISFIAAKTVYPRKIVMEEETATSSPFSVRSIEIIDRLSKEYPDNFLPISIHVDEMDTKNYEPVKEKFPMFPNSLVNRINITDGMLYDQVMETMRQQKLYAEAMITPTAIFTKADSSSVMVITESVFGFSDTNGSAYRIAYVVMEDNVGPYIQYNGYSNPSADYDESDFMDGWVHKGPEVEMVYNHVARAIIGGVNGVAGSVPSTIKEGVTYKYKYSFKLPDNIQSKKNIRIVTLLIDEKTGEIINAAMVPMSKTIPGDVTVSGSVDVQDATIAVNYILGEESDEYNYAAADMNGDGEVDVFDVQAIVNVILSNNNTASSRRSSDYDDANESICLTAERKGILFGIDDAERFTSFQFNVEVPEGVSLLDAMWNGPASHTLHFSKTGDNRYTVVVLSLESAPLPSLNDAPVILRLSDMSKGEAAFDNILFVTPQGEAAHFNGSTLNMTTGIREIIRTDNAQIYDLSGRRLVMKSGQLPKGVYIINNKKVVIK